jgi:hypothetical protein
MNDEERYLKQKKVALYYWLIDEFNIYFNSSSQDVRELILLRTWNIIHTVL